MSQINRYDSNDSCELAYDGDYVKFSDHEAEVARLRVMAQEQGVKDGHEITRLRAELNAATKAGLDAIAAICEKEREADALRADAERYRWLRTDSAISAIPRVWSSDESAYPVTPLHLEFLDEAIDAAMGEGK